MDTYFSDKAYDELVAALAAIEPCPFSGKRERYQMVDVLMEARIWPARVRPGRRTPISNKPKMIIT